MRTGELISSAGRSPGVWTMRLRVLRAVVMENGRRLFCRESGALGNAGGSAPFALGVATRRDATLNWGDQWLLLVCRSCLAVVFGCKRQRETRRHIRETRRHIQEPRQAQPARCSLCSFSPFLSGSRAVGRFPMTLRVIFENVQLTHFPGMFSVTNPGCKSTDAKLTAK